MTFTQYAIKHKFVKEQPDYTFMWDDPKTGRYLAFGHDVNRKRFSMSYQTGYMNMTQIWADYRGRWGLKSIWWEDPQTNKRYLIHRKD